MKKFLCLLLVIVMVAMPLVACKDDSDGGKETDGGNQPVQTAAQSGDGTGTAASTDVYEVPETLKFDGKAFNFLYEQEQGYGYFPLDFDEPSSEDAYANAIYLRNSAVEDQLGVTLVGSEQTSSGNVQTAFQTDNGASGGEWNAAFFVVANAAKTTAAGDCLSFDELPYVNLDNSWWNRDCTEQLALAGEHYMVSGDIMIGDKDVLWAMYFIKSRLEEVIANPANASLKRPYELMDENNWTWDNMMALAAGAARDENADDKMAIGSSDIFGLCTHNENYAALWESAGLKLCTNDQFGEPVVEWGDNEHFVDVYNYGCETIMNDTQVVAASSDQGGDPIAWITTAMKNNKTLFGTEVIAFVRQYRNNEEAFGIVPFPKYDSSVDRYYSYVAINSAVCTVEYTHPDGEFTGAVLETMASLGQKYIIPEYRDMQLKGRFSDDPESAGSLDIILNNRCYDMGVFYDWGFEALRKPGVNPTTVWGGNKKSIQLSVNRTLGKLLDR